jgi:predicted ABC-type ATPase
MGGAILDPDAIATRLDPTRPERAAIRAGSELIRRRDRLLVERESCIVETTLAGLTTLRHIEAARAAGFQVHLIYICAEPVETCIRRVAERSLTNLPLVLARCDVARLFDNSGAGSGTLVLAVSGQRVTYRAATLPAWLRRSVGTLAR